MFYGSPCLSSPLQNFSEGIDPGDFEQVFRDLGGHSNGTQRMKNVGKLGGILGSTL